MLLDKLTTSMDHIPESEGMDDIANPSQLSWSENPRLTGTDLMAGHWVPAVWQAPLTWSLPHTFHTQARFNTNGTLPYIDRHRTVEQLLSRVSQTVPKSEYQNFIDVHYIKKKGKKILCWFLRQAENSTVVYAHNPGTQKVESEGSGIQIPP